MATYWYVSGYRSEKEDPKDERGRVTKEYSETLMAPQAAFNDFMKIVNSDEFSYAVLEWMKEE